MAPRCQLLELPVQIDQTEIAALQNCSATHNFTSSGLVGQLQFQSSVGPSLIVSMANTSVVMMNRFVTVPLQFGPSLQQINFQVLPNLPTPIVFGMQFLDTINPMVDWISKSVTQMDYGQDYTLKGKKWSNLGPVQLVSLKAFYYCMQDFDCTSNWKVQIKP